MLQLKVEAIKQEATDTRTFFLKEINGEKIHYKAGQFLTFIFSHHQEEIRRSYSLSSSPLEELLAITVKRIPNGEISRYLFTKIQVGDVLSAIEPAGKFILTDNHVEKDLLIFAAGSGITPVFSLLKHTLTTNPNRKITLFYSSLSSTSIIFKTEIDNLAQLYAGRFKVVYLLSSEANRLNNIKVEQLVHDHAPQGLNNTLFYLCGPFSYMRMIRLTLIFMGVDTSNIRKENFVLDTVPVAGTVKTYAPQKVKITFKKKNYDIVVNENQSILQAALQNNIILPYSCRAGVCSACVALCQTGKVEMAHNDVLTNDDLSKGWILTCTGHPLSETEISV